MFLVQFKRAFLYFLNQLFHLNLWTCSGGTAPFLSLKVLWEQIFDEGAMARKRD